MEVLQPPAWNSLAGPMLLQAYLDPDGAAAACASAAGAGVGEGQVQTWRCCLTDRPRCMLMLLAGPEGQACASLHDAPLPAVQAGHAGTAKLMNATGHAHKADLCMPMKPFSIYLAHSCTLANADARHQQHRRIVYRHMDRIYVLYMG